MNKVSKELFLEELNESSDHHSRTNAENMRSRDALMIEGQIHCYENNSGGYFYEGIKGFSSAVRWVDRA